MFSYRVSWVYVRCCVRVYVRFDGRLVYGCILVAFMHEVEVEVMKGKRGMLLICIAARLLQYLSCIQVMFWCLVKAARGFGSGGVWRVLCCCARRGAARVV